ncbi:MAG TPA: acetyltransferase [Rhizomicrobium sp.]|jgi:sugar O-acyltransferase (sialic acid O-acetyltransferase NeuD family)
MKPVVIVNAGSGGQASVLLDACEAAGIPVAGWLSASENTRYPGAPHLGDVTLLDAADFLAQHDIIVGSGNGAFRRTLSLKVLANGGALATIHHPSSVVSSRAAIGAGSFLAALCMIGVNAVVGRFCIVNTGATIDHDNVLADGVNISPGVHFAGGVRCGEDAFVGVGASVAPGIRIGSGATVGAGAVVIRDVPDGATVVGNPARVLQR